MKSDRNDEVLSEQLLFFLKKLIMIFILLYQVK